MLVLAAGLTTAIAAVPAVAQNALGTGNALDANSRQGSNGINGPGRDVNAIIRQANAIVDGTAAGGRQFRGGGVTRSGSMFRDTLGGDQNYTFQRDAAMSGLATSRGRSTDLLAAQSALYTGNTTPDGFADDLNPRRFAATTTGAVVSSLRSTAQREWDQARQPSVLGVITARSDTRERQITYQPLRGLSFSELDNTDVLPFSPLERPAGLRLNSFGPSGDPTQPDGIIDRRINPDGTPRNPTNDPANNPTRPGNTLDSGRIPTRVDEIDRRFAEARAEAARTNATAAAATEATGTEARPGTTPPPATTRPGVDPELEKLRQGLRPTRPARTIPGTNSGTAGATAQPGDLPATTNPAGKSPAGTPDRSSPRPPSTTAQRNATQVPPVGSPLVTENLGAIDTLRKMSQDKPIASLSAKPQSESDWYNIIMSRGQELVNTGKYFEAEEVYTRLLSAKEGDSMARLGRVHAQLGAGAYLTAGKGLIELYRDKPQLVPTRLEEGAVMPRTVATSAAKQLTAELDKPSSAIAGEAAVLLAYLGYQYNEAEWLSRGLSDASKRAADFDQPVVELIGQVWKAPGK